MPGNSNNDLRADLDVLRGRVLALTQAVHAALLHVPNGDLTFLLKEMKEVLDGLNEQVRPGFEGEYNDIKTLIEATRR